MPYYGGYRSRWGWRSGGGYGYRRPWGGYKKTWAKKAVGRPYSSRKAASGALKRNLNEHNFKRMGETKTSLLTPYTLSSNEVWYFDAMNFDLAQIQDATDLTALYDTYRIKGVKVEFNFNSSAAPNDPVSFEDRVPEGMEVWVFEDLTDSTTPTTPSEFTSRSGVRRLFPDNSGMVSIFLRPKPLGAVYNGVEAPAAAATWTHDAKAPFFSCSYPGIPHYGLKIAYKFRKQQGVTPNFYFSPTYNRQYWFTMKDPR